MTETIWELFRHCRQDIQILIYSRHFANLEMKLNYLMNGQDDLKKEIDFVEFLLLEEGESSE